MNKVIIFSGGLDSTVLLYDVVSKLKEGEVLYCLNFYYGQRNAHECTAAQKIVDGLKNKTPNKIVNYNISLKHVFEYLTKSALLNGNYDVPKAKDVLGDPQPLSYVPNRNMIMLSVATGFAESTESDEVFYGAQQADTLSGYWDASAEFLKAVNNVVTLNRKNAIKIQAPLINLNKEQIINLGVSLNVPFEDTWTCYDPQENLTSCGECVACANRIQGFINAGVKDPMKYSFDIDWSTFGIK